MLTLMQGHLRMEVNITTIHNLTSLIVGKHERLEALIGSLPEGQDQSVSPHYDHLQEYSAYTEILDQLKEITQQLTQKTQEDFTMENTQTLPHYYKSAYRWNPQTRYFEDCTLPLGPEGAIKHLPAQLRVDTTSAERIRANAQQMIVSKERNGNNFKFRTGLQPTLHAGWYLGDDYQFIGGKKVKSLMLFHFTGDGHQLHVYYFRHFDKPSTHLRMKWAHEVIPLLVPPVMG